MQVGSPNSLVKIFKIISDYFLGVVVVDPVTGAGLSTFPVSAEQLTLRVDTSAAPIIYIGEAVPGTATGAASWRIQRANTSIIDIKYADGNDDFDNIWDNRAGLSYS